MKKVKITISKTTFQEDLALKYGADDISACPLLSEGQVFYTDHDMPEGFCEGAWKSIEQCVHEFAERGYDEKWYFKEWIKTPSLAVISCNDGIRPVIMTIEATDIESEGE